MKRFIITLFFLLLLFNISYSQTGVFGSLQVHSNINLNQRTIYNFNNDTTFAAHDSSSIPTVWAVYNFVANHAGGSSYSLPTASSSVLGGVKIGAGINISSGVISATPTFSAITSKPTTLAGYGITDAYPLSGNPSEFLTTVPAQSFSSLTGKPTTLSGYGITDPVVLTTNSYSNPAWIAAIPYSILSGTPPTWNQNTTGTASNLTAAALLPNGTTATTQSTTDSSLKLATTAFFKTAPIKASQLVGLIPVGNLPKDTVFTSKGIESDTTTNPGHTILKLDSTYVDSTVRSIATSGGIVIKGKYANQSAAMIGGLSNGDVYELPADGNGNHGLAVLDTTIVYGLRFTTDNTSGSYALDSILIEGSATMTVTVNWGDGNQNTYSGANSYIAEHTYTSNAIFNAQATFSDNSLVTKIYLNSYAVKRGITKVSGFNIFPNLSDLEMPNMLLTNVDTMSLPNSLRILELTNNNITSFNRSLPTSLTYLALTSNSTLSSITLLNYPIGLSTGSTDNGFFANGCALPVLNVNSLLQGFDAAFTSGSIGSIYLQGQTPTATPTGAGATAKTSLISKGETVNTD